MRCSAPTFELRLKNENIHHKYWTKLDKSGNSVMNRKGTKEETSDEPSTHLLHSSSLAKQMQEKLLRGMVMEFLIRLRKSHFLPPFLCCSKIVFLYLLKDAKNYCIRVTV